MMGTITVWRGEARYANKKPRHMAGARSQTPIRYFLLSGSAFGLFGSTFDSFFSLAE
jgi:hypothetical protein